jgi:beta-galactosidase/beta-glucuronidase
MSKLPVMRFLLLSFLFFFSLLLNAQSNWQPVAGHIMSPWAEKLDPKAVLPEYPRPQMVRPQWTNLNGLWEYSILPSSSNQMTQTDGQILVPFAVESALSGVGKRVGKDSLLWYKRTVAIKPRKNERTLLHFGAVDWHARVFVNGQEAGWHQGGYSPFTIDITRYLSKSGRQEITVRVWDPTDDGPQPRGKQIKNPHGIWYTPVTGIWQTVWMEQVPESYIVHTQQSADIDKKQIRVSAEFANSVNGEEWKVTVLSGENIIAEKQTAVGNELQLDIPSPRLWSPSDPFLYDLKISLYRKGKLIDEVASYIGMRKISMVKDANGIQRMQLNNQFLFQYGPLDQGWWPDGLYTAPTDEALRFDIEKTREMGFNMIRKHVKAEPARWYYHCDRLGLLVWQDMPSGDMGNAWEMRPGIYGKATDRERSPESEAIYRSEWKELIESLYNFTSIVVWVPFNEAWGQFKTKEIVDFTMQQDPTRLVNAASGGNFEETSHITDLHNYPEPLMPDPFLFGSRRILVLGEFGGLGLPVEGHTWQEKNNWGYQSFKNKEELWQRYEEFVRRIPHLIDKGLSAAVYTQTTDVEVETNGLMTYDRKLIKFPEEKMKALHAILYKN